MPKPNCDENHDLFRGGGAKLAEEFNLPGLSRLSTSWLAISLVT